jgi:hypothetical protein
MRVRTRHTSVHVPWPLAVIFVPIAATWWLGIVLFKLCLVGSILFAKLLVILTVATVALALSAGRGTCRFTRLLIGTRHV